MTFPKISASLMAADLTRLGDEMQAMTHAGIDAFHWDIMDGHFVPNLTFGADHIIAARPLTPTYFDVHLMVKSPEDWVDRFAHAGADGISFHAEVPQNHLTILKQIKSYDIDAGIAFNPQTQLDVIAPELWSYIDRILIMTVRPGFGGQAFMDQTGKIQDAVKLKQLYPHLNIIVDGGINDQTAKSVIAAGATTLISGSYLFKNKNGYTDAIASLRAAS